MRNLIALLCGLLFGFGLALSRMVDPARVIGFLDIAGQWDPTLAFVMGGALLITIPGFRMVLKRQQPVLAEAFELPGSQAIDWRLVGGAVVFGIGWGIGGLCPGPALVNLITGMPQIYLFVVSMIAGMLLSRLLPSG